MITPTIENKSITHIASESKESNQSVFVINITGKCNQKCIHCWNANYINYELNYNEIQTIINNIPPEARIHFLGGEPLLHKEIIKLIDYSSSKGHYTSLVTNGTKILEVGISKLINAGISEIGISIDGSNQHINDNIRGNGSFHLAWEALKSLSDYKSKYSKLKILLSTTVMAQNINDIPFLLNNISKDSIFIDKVVLERVTPEGCGCRSDSIILLPF